MTTDHPNNDSITTATTISKNDADAQISTSATIKRIAMQLESQDSPEVQKPSSNKERGGCPKLKNIDPSLIFPSQYVDRKTTHAKGDVCINAIKQPTTATGEPNYPYQKDLPLSIKNILSPNARTKSHRRSCYLYRHSSKSAHKKVDTNLLLLLHGAGDSHQQFHTFAKGMELPQTASLSLNASSMGDDDSSSGGFVTLPYGLGSTWFHEMEYEVDGSFLDVDDEKRCASLEAAVGKIDRLIEELTALWVPGRIFLFGYSAGACLAMETCLDRMRRSRRPLGGAVCVAGGIKGQSCLRAKCTPDTYDGKGQNEGSATPVLILGGEDDTNFPPPAVDEAVRGYNKLHKIMMNFSSEGSAKAQQEKAANSYVMKGKGHGMVNSPEEVEVIMKFFSKRLVRWMVGIEGWSEVT